MGASRTLSKILTCALAYRVAQLHVAHLAPAAGCQVVKTQRVRILYFRLTLSEKLLLSGGGRLFVALALNVGCDCLSFVIDYQVYRVPHVGLQPVDHTLSIQLHEAEPPEAEKQDVREGNFFKLVSWAC